MTRILTNGLFRIEFTKAENTNGYVERVIDEITNERISLKHYNGTIEMNYAINNYLESGLYKEVNA